MDIHQTEEQQVEAIKSFWKEYGNTIIVGLAIGFSGFIGLNLYNENKLEKETAIAESYQQILELVDDNNGENFRIQADKFITEHADSSYAVLTALTLAKNAADHKDWPKVEEYLTTAINKTTSDAIKGVATLRKARVQIQQEKIEQALATLNVALPKSFKAPAEEIKGDAYLKQGKIELARNAYQAAIDANGDAVTPVLQMKLDDLAENVNLGN